MQAVSPDDWILHLPFLTLSTAKQEMAEIVTGCGILLHASRVCRRQA